MKNEIAIQELLEELDFSDLTRVQKEMVLFEMTEKEYKELRKTVEMTMSYFDDEPKLMADDSLKPLRRKENVVIRTLSYKVPIYKVAAAVILFFSISFLVSNKVNKDTIEIVERVKEVQGFDTLSIVNEMERFTSKNSIKYNTGLARVY